MSSRRRQGGTEKADSPLFETTRADGHSHTLRPGQDRTSTNDGHWHRIVLGSIKKHPDGHTHDIARQIDEVEEPRVTRSPPGTA